MGEVCQKCEFSLRSELRTSLESEVTPPGLTDPEEMVEGLGGMSRRGLTGAHTPVGRGKAPAPVATVPEEAPALGSTAVFRTLALASLTAARISSARLCGGAESPADSRRSRSAST